MRVALGVAALITVLSVNERPGIRVAEPPVESDGAREFERRGRNDPRLAAIASAADGRPGLVGAAPFSTRMRC